MAVLTDLPFRFDPGTHRYIALDTGEVLPSITQMLADTGWVDNEFYTAESRTRGTAVHILTADYDLGAIQEPGQVSSRYKSYLMAYVRAMAMLNPTIVDVEVPMVHPTYRFGGRPDRIVEMNGKRGVLEIKSGGPERQHRIQTALQAILDSARCGMPAEALSRWCLYLKDTGKFALDVHPDRRDFDEARRVIRKCCG